MSKWVAGEPMQTQDGAKARALRFVVLLGVMSFFADFTYEGSRSILGPYLAVLGASDRIVGVVAGFGEPAGYGLRFGSGCLADRTQKFWSITIFGYIVQMAAVPALVLAHSWPAASLLLILERVGKATRNPPRDVMLSHAAAQLGVGRAFGLQEALDQFGVLFFPLPVAVVLARRNEYRSLFSVLLLPALIMLTLLGVSVKATATLCMTLVLAAVPFFFANRQAGSGTEYMEVAAAQISR